MTVKQMIDELNKLPANALVMVETKEEVDEVANISIWTCPDPDEDLPQEVYLNTCNFAMIRQQRLSDIKMSDIRKRCMKLQKHKE